MIWRPLYRVPVCLAFACLLVLGGCRHRHKPTRVYRQLIPLPPPGQAADVDAPPAFDLARTFPPPFIRPVQFPPPPKPPVRRRIVRPGPKPEVVPDHPVEPPIPPPPPSLPPPQLGEVMTDEARRQLLAATDQFVSQATAIADRYRGRTLTARQKELYDQATILAERAKSLRGTDVSAAKVLAERALKIAQDLANDAK